MAYIGKTPTIGNFQICDAISVVDAQAAYTMQVGSVDVSPESANHMIVSLNGVIQKPTDSYTVSGSTITFASALETGDVIDFIQILGNVLDLGVPSDATVTSAKLSTLTSAMNFQGAASDMRLNFDTTDTIANASPLMAITAKNKTDSVAQISMRRESSVSDGYIALSTQSTGGALNEKVRIHSGGVMSATQGIALGVGTANTASNVLDDYEEGTFTPTIGPLDGLSSVSYTTQSGVYTKVGRIVHFRFFLRCSGTANSNDINIYGLPFTSSTSEIGGAVFAYLHSSIINSTSTNPPVLQIPTNNTLIKFQKTNGSDFTGNDLSSTGDIQFYITGTYETA
jgi:hypothetical protein